MIPYHNILEHLHKGKHDHIHHNVIDRRKHPSVLMADYSGQQIVIIVTVC
jgi:hypothetical protein